MLTEQFQPAGLVITASKLSNLLNCFCNFDSLAGHNSRPSAGFSPLLPRGRLKNNRSNVLLLHSPWLTVNWDSDWVGGLRLLIQTEWRRLPVDSNGCWWNEWQTRPTQSRNQVVDSQCAPFANSAGPLQKTYGVHMLCYCSST